MGLLLFHMLSGSFLGLFFFYQGRVLAQHYGKPYAALKSIELDLIKRLLVRIKMAGKTPSPKTNSTCGPPLKTAEHKLFSVGLKVTALMSAERKMIHFPYRDAFRLSSKHCPSF
ncbi:hypothetical protein XENOCAPTIV_009571 [Xenoophorus captivus]|uniref:Secreted protein n=1 Tax=Xenoophorus captivus TaxID=1517983 RepID=A0ABV0RIB5_9TELE